MKVYISGKMSGLSREEIMQRFMLAEHTLRSQGFTTCNPVRFVFFRWQWFYNLLGYQLALCIDLFMLSRCDAIYMVGLDWDSSQGATVEHHYATTYRKWLLYQFESTNPQINNLNKKKQLWKLQSMFPTGKK